MPRQTETYRVFISSPSDLAQDRQTVKTAVFSASRMLSPRGITLEPWLWEEDATSEFDGAAQESIASQLGDYDFYVGLMGSGFGSATTRYGSGTEEEFNDALTAHKAGNLKRIGFFFKNIGIETGKINDFILTQLQKINDFKRELNKIGLHKSFENEAQLTSLITEFLVRSFDNYTGPAGSEKLVGQSSGDRVTGARSSISSSFEKDVLSSMDVEITMGNAAVSLNDLWVDLDLKATLLNENGSTSKKIYSIESISKDIRLGKAFHVCGRDVSGKTAICRRLFWQLHSIGLYPVILSGKEIKFSDHGRISNRIIMRISEQYEGISQSQAREITPKDIVVILDDFDLMPLSAKLSLEVLSFLRERFLSVEITTSVSYSFSVFEKTDGISILGKFTKVEIQELGQRRRYDIIEKWYHLKENGDSDKNKLRHKIEQTRIEINRILITHIVPRTPLIVLILLQAIDNNQIADLAQSGYVRYYKFLIDNAILRNLTIDEAELAYALLPQLAWAAYNTELKELFPEEAEKVVDEFSARRAIRKANLYSVLERLRNIGMFDQVVAGYRFKHAYAYHFFLADYFSQNILKDEIADHIRDLCNRSWSKECTTILIFISFHSNSSIITDSLMNHLRNSYKDAVEFDFQGKNAEALNKLVSVAPTQVVDHDRAKERRASRLDAEDLAHSSPSDREINHEQNSPPGGMQSVFMAVEVLGHILRNHYARLDADPKREIFEVVTSAVLRCAGGFISMLSENIELITNYTSSIIIQLNAKEDKDTVVAITRTMIFLLSVGLIYYCAKKLSQAVGDENLEITYEQAIQNTSTISKKFIDVIIKLDCFHDFPLKDLTQLVGSVKENHIAIAALRGAVSERLDMRPPSAHADFQRYCKVVGLEAIPRLLERQRLGSKPDL
jgi:hypothetical protein